MCVSEKVCIRIRVYTFNTDKMRAGFLLKLFTETMRHLSPDIQLQIDSVAKNIDSFFNAVASRIVIHDCIALY